MKCLLASVAAALLALAAMGSAPSAQAQQQVSVHLGFLGLDEGAGPSPYELAGGRVVFRMEAAGREVWGLLDNRSERSLVDSTFATAAGIAIGPESGTVRSTVGTAPKRRADVPLVIPKQLRTTYPMAALDLKPLSTATGREISIVLGGDFFDYVAVLVDARTRELRVAPSGSMNPTGAIASLPLQKGSHQIDAKIDQKPTLLTIDLGFEGAVGLSPTMWSRLNPTAAGAPVAGVMRLPELQVADVKANGVPAETAALAPEDGEAVLGMGFLRRMVFIIDAGAGRMWIAAPPPPVGPTPPASPAEL